MNPDDIPIIIGVGQKTERGQDLSVAASPMDLMEQAVMYAAKDAAIDKSLLSTLDVIAVVKSLYPFTKNPPETLAKRIGSLNSLHFETPIGGNMPQYLINRYSEEIANRKIRFALFAGTEAMDTGRRFIKAGQKPDWDEGAEEEPRSLVRETPMATNHEKAHGIWPARNVYPLFENALRKSYGNSIADHQLEIGTLFSRFSEVAEKEPFAWFPTKRSPEEIATVSDTNRMVGWPYTKYMNAMNQVNQSAAILLTSVGYAKEMGVPQDKWIYLHGCADVNEKWHVSNRVNYHSSPAIRKLGERAFSMARKTADDMDFIDLYSCFPVAVEMARDELGITKNDPRPLTVTGGLPYHGGAGSYVINAIVNMTEKLRKNPGKFGLITANGGYLSEHSAGIYSTTPSPRPDEGDIAWQRADPAIDQIAIDELKAPPFTNKPDGVGTIETYTIASGRDGKPNMGIVIGRLGKFDDPNAPRFIANTPADKHLLKKMMETDYIGATGTVTHDKDRNLFTPN
ncbi:MAG: acetyl-CoA acetyltransferase [Sneathiella sp.]